MQATFTSLTQHVLIPKESYELILEYAQSHEDHRTFIPDVEFTDYNESFSVMNKFIEDALSSIRTGKYSDEQISIATQRFVTESARLWPTKEVHHNRILKYMEDAYRVPEKAQQCRDKLMVEHIGHADAITYMYTKYLEAYASRVMNDIGYIEAYTQGIPSPMMESFDGEFHGYYMAEDLGSQIMAIPGMIIKLIKKLMNSLSYSLSEAGKAFANRILANGQVDEEVIKKLYELYVAKNKAAAQLPIRYPNPQKVNELRQAYAAGFDAFTKQMTDMIRQKDYKNVDVGVVQMIQRFQIVTQNESLPRSASFQEFRTAILSIANNILLMNMFMKSLVEIDKCITSESGIDPKELDKALKDEKMNQTLVNRQSTVKTESVELDDYINAMFEDATGQPEKEPAAKVKVRPAQQTSQEQQERLREQKKNSEIADAKKVTDKYTAMGGDPTKTPLEIKGTLTDYGIKVAKALRPTIGDRMKDLPGAAINSALDNLPDMFGVILTNIFSMFIGKIGGNVEGLIAGMLGMESSEVENDDSISAMFELDTSGKETAVDANYSEVQDEEVDAPDTYDVGFNADGSMFVATIEWCQQFVGKLNFTEHVTKAKDMIIEYIAAILSKIGGSKNQTQLPNDQANTNGPVAGNQPDTGKPEQSVGEHHQDSIDVIAMLDLMIENFSDDTDMSEMFEQRVRRIPTEQSQPVANIRRQGRMNDNDNRQAVRLNNAEIKHSDMRADNKIKQSERETTHAINQETDAIRNEGRPVNKYKGFMGFFRTKADQVRGIFTGRALMSNAKTISKILNSNSKEEVIKNATSLATSILGRGNLLRDLGAISGYAKKQQSQGTGLTEFINDENLHKNLAKVAIVGVAIGAVVCFKLGIVRNPIESLRNDTNNYKNGKIPAPRRLSQNVSDTKAAVPQLVVQLWQNSDQAVKNLWTYINGWLYGGQPIKGSKEKTVGIGQMIKDELTSLSPYVNLKDAIKIDLPEDNTQQRR